MDSVLSFIGLMKRAGAVCCGGEAAYDSCRRHKARLLALAQDAAQRTQDGARNAAEECGVSIIQLPFGKAELGDALGTRDCSILSICDTGFAQSLCNKLGLQEPAQALSQRLEREKRRKQKKLDRTQGKPAKPNTRGK